MTLNSFGGPESFELSDVPKPVPQLGQVLVRVHATSINPLDYQVRRGDYRDLVPLPAITGHDVSGVVEAVGPGVTAFSPGDEVWYTPQIFDGPGSYAEYHVVNENIIGRKPGALSHLEAASLSLVGGTAWEALVSRATLRADAIMRETGGLGVDVVFDTLGGDTLSQSPKVLAQLGRVVSIVDIAQPQNLIEAWGKNASYHFVFTRQNQGKLDELSTLVERGQLRPHVGAVYSLADLPLAHALLEKPNNGLRGKIAIAVNPSADTKVQP